MFITPSRISVILTMKKMKINISNVIKYYYKIALI